MLWCKYNTVYNEQRMEQVGKLESVQTIRSQQHQILQGSARHVVQHSAV